MAEFDREEYDEEMDRREFRRKRRARNQLIAYISTALVLVLMVTGIGIAAHKGFSILGDRKQAKQLQEQLDEMSAAEVEPVVVEAPAETEIPQEETDPLDEKIAEQLAQMPIEDKVAGLFIITPEALTGTDTAIKAGDTTKEKLTAYAVGGLVYSEQNIKTTDQFAEMLSNTLEYSKYPLFTAVEEEGGDNSPIAASGLADKTESMGTIGAEGDSTAAKAAGSSIAAYLSAFGINLDFAPVADVVTEDNTTMGERAFGSNGGQNGTMVAAVVEGLQEGGVSACLKYFPSLESTTENVSGGMIKTEKTLEDLETSDFLSFQAGIDAGADFVMVSHVSVPNVTGDNTPASLSEKIITEILRGSLSFDGIVITDAMNQGAIMEYYAADEAAVKALQAGADMILMPEDFETAYNGVLDAVNNGTLSEERIDQSLQRIYRVKYRNETEE
jgi:beta-N-acetylhexosaminidase